MSIDIAKMVVNIGQSQSFNWSIFWTTVIGALATLVAAFVGAWLAFSFNNNAMKKKEKILQITKLKYLAISTFSLLDYICNLIKLIDRNIDITENKSNEILTIFECVNININFDVKVSDYDFTSQYPVLLDDLNVIFINLKILTNSLSNTDKYISRNIEDLTQDKIISLNKRLKDLKMLALNIILNIEALKTSIKGYFTQYLNLNNIPTIELDELEKKYLSQAIYMKQQEAKNAN